MQEPFTRNELKARWEDLWARVGDDEALRGGFMHFPPGTPVATVTAWFGSEHARIDAGEVPVVVVRTRSFPFGKGRRYVGRKVTFRHRHVFVDGVERPELAGADIRGVEWVSSHGTVECDDLTRIRGTVNGVVMDVGPRGRKRPGQGPGSFVRRLMACLFAQHGGRQGGERWARTPRD